MRNTAQQTARKCGRIEPIVKYRADGHPSAAYCGRCGMIVESDVVGDVQRYRHGSTRIAADIR